VTKSPKSPPALIFFGSAEGVFFSEGNVSLGGGGVLGGGVVGGNGLVLKALDLLRYESGLKLLVNL
jgi:hypothetical protein